MRRLPDERREMKLRLIFLVTALLAAQTARTVWDGVYTDAQAKRGQALYIQECASCHAADLTGGEQAPPLAGADFIGPWNGLTVGGLFDRIRQTMPQDDPGKLSAREGADVVAFLLSANGFPPGKAELDDQTEALKQIRIVVERPKD
jgi:quinoprotein glucose dehydrogenase